MAKSRTRRQRRFNRVDEELADAMAAFSLNYGRDETKLDKWQLLCDDCGARRGTSITKCKAVLRAVAVNIWDLLRARATGDLPVQKYKSKGALQLDLKENPSRRFPLARVKQADDNKLLKALLVTIA